MPEPKRIVVIDDDREIRETLCEILIEEGYHATGLENGREALEYLQDSQPPCLIFLDLMMPVMDGWEFLRRWQNHPRKDESAVVVITAVGHAITNLKGAKQILPKPLRIEVLLEALKQHCA